MADPLLASLCSICHIQPPKYRCPRCGTRTCSLPCNKKHKNWSSCNGERDPTVFVPAAKLKTEAGIDHDYNFLTKIERSVEIAEKILRDEREILPQEGHNAQRPTKRARLHKGRSRGRVTLDDSSSRRWDRNSLQRMHRLGIHVSSVPFGMSRSKENKSSWNKRTGTINWQIEWIVLDDATPAEKGAAPKPTRIMHKLLDQTPLYVGFANSLGYHRYQKLSEQQRVEEKKARKRQQAGRDDEADIDGESADFGQDTQSTAWKAHSAPIQDQETTAWDGPERFRHVVEPTDESHRNDYQFFFQKPKRPSRAPETLIPLEPTENLATILPGLEVLEFPTICVLPAGSPIPTGYVLESRPKPKDKTTSKKRKSSALVDYAESSDGEDDVMDEDEEEEGDDTEGSEDGEVQDQGPVEEAETTSSSGSDSELDID
ncbi:hypothetical protein DL771_002473 [Monosporascus sp. 5C6A]|nr:hypothetical protein DL771_002473 [Monosporascus sp. 5C6A]